MSVSATSFVPRASALDIALQIENLSGSAIPGIDFQITESPLVKVQVLSAIETRIEPRSLIHHTLTIQADELVVPQLLKLLVIPNGGDVDTLDTRLKIFPSHFFSPGDRDAIEFAERQAVALFEVKCPIDRTPPEIVKTVADVFQGTVVRESEDGSEFVLLAKWVSGKYAVCSMIFHGTEVGIGVRTPNDALSEAVCREIEMRIARDGHRSR
jgi:hypothetical protein